jgi:hypothetical protein
VAREVNSPGAVNNYRLFQDPPRFPGASTVHSSLIPRINKPAGLAHRLIDRRYRMKQHLILLPLMIVMIATKVKVIIKIIVHMR